MVYSPEFINLLGNKMVNRSKSSVTPSKARNNENAPSHSIPVEWANYIGYLTRHRLLTHDEERSLAYRCQNGDRDARNRLVEANMRLVVNVARSYHSFLIPFEDLVQEGSIGLIAACDRFDPTKGYRFSTYATHWIRQAISRAIDNKAHSIRIPSHVADTLRKVEKERVSHIRQTGEEPDIETLACRMQMKPERLQSYINLSTEPLSLDILVGNEENSTLGSVLEDHEAYDPEEVVLYREMKRLLNNMLNSLNARERDIIRQRLGFDHDNPLVLQEIGENLSLSRERVRQIEAQAMERLKSLAQYQFYDE